MPVEGWARIYEEPEKKAGGIFTFTHTIFIYGSRLEALGKETDKDSKCLGIFPICFEILGDRLVFQQPGAPREVEPEPEVA